MFLPGLEPVTHGTKTSALRMEAARNVRPFRIYQATRRHVTKDDIRYSNAKLVTWRFTQTAICSRSYQLHNKKVDPIFFS
jgi:hypothetical protein